MVRSGSSTSSIEPNDIFFSKSETNRLFGLIGYQGEHNVVLSALNSPRHFCLVEKQGTAVRKGTPAMMYRDGEKRRLLAQLDLINHISLVVGRYPYFDQEVRAEMREFARDDISLREGDCVTCSASPSAPPRTCGT